MKSMLRLMAMLGFVAGISALGHAGTPQENGQVPSQTASFSGTTILTSSATTSGTATVTLTVSTPTVINSGGGTYNGRNCFTRFVVQMATTTVLTIADNATTVWTVNGAGLGTTGTNTIVLPEDHLGPFCTAAGDKTVFTLTPTAGNAVNPTTINVEGYTTYGGTLNSGPMY